MRYVFTLLLRHDIIRKSPGLVCVTLSHACYFVALLRELQGLTREQWLWSLGFGLAGLLFARIPQCVPQLANMFPEFGRREEEMMNEAPLALGLRGRSPGRMSDRCLISTVAVAKKYARRAKVLTISRMRAKKSQLQADAVHHTAPPELDSAIDSE